MGTIKNNTVNDNTSHCNSNSESRALSYPLNTLPVPTTTGGLRSSSPTCQQPSKTNPSKDDSKQVSSTYTRSHPSKIFAPYQEDLYEQSAQSPLVSLIQKQTSSNHVRRCRIRPRGQPPS